TMCLRLPGAALPASGDALTARLCNSGLTWTPHPPGPLVRPGRHLPPLPGAERAQAAPGRQAARRLRLDAPAGGGAGQVLLSYCPASRLSVHATLVPSRYVVLHDGAGLPVSCRCHVAVIQHVWVLPAPPRSLAAAKALHNASDSSCMR